MMDNYSRERAWAKRMAPFETLAREFLVADKQLEDHGFCEMTHGFLELYSQHIVMQARPTLEIETLSKQQIEREAFYSKCIVISVCEPERPKATITDWKQVVEETLRLEFHDADGGRCNDCGRSLGEAPPMQIEHGHQVLDFVERHLTAHLATFTAPVLIDRPPTPIDSPMHPPLLAGPPITPLKVYVHCTAGMCRSPGIAQALAWIYNFDEKAWKSRHDHQTYPSHYTYTSTREAWRIRCRAGTKP